MLLLPPHLERSLSFVDKLKRDEKLCNSLTRIMIHSFLIIRGTKLYELLVSQKLTAGTRGASPGSPLLAAKAQWDLQGSESRFMLVVSTALHKEITKNKRATDPVNNHTIFIFRSISASSGFP